MLKYNNPQPALVRQEGHDQFVVKHSHPEDLLTFNDAIGGVLNGNGRQVYEAKKKNLQGCMTFFKEKAKDKTISSDERALAKAALAEDEAIAKRHNVSTGRRCAIM